MAREIVDVMMGNDDEGNHVRRIERVHWRDEETGVVGEETVAEVIETIDAGVEYFTIGDGPAWKGSPGRQLVEVVRFPGEPPYIRSMQDGSLSDNLLAIARSKIPPR